MVPEISQKGGCGIMLKVYAWNVCPHCRRTVEWLKAHEVPYE